MLGEPTLEVRAEDKLVYTMPYEEEEDRVSEVKCPKGGGVCDNGATAISFPFFIVTLSHVTKLRKACPQNYRLQFFYFDKSET